MVSTEPSARAKLREAIKTDNADAYIYTDEMIDEVVKEAQAIQARQIAELREAAEVTLRIWNTPRDRHGWTEQWHTALDNLAHALATTERLTPADESEPSLDEAAIRRDERAKFVLSGHKCRPIAVLPMQEGRDWWLGELTEPLTDWPQETHCLHLTTPLKEVVLGIYRGDTDLLAVVCRIVSGYLPAEHWLDNIEKAMRANAVERDPEREQAVREQMADPQIAIKVRELHSERKP